MQAMTVNTASKPALAPVRLAERIETIDILRGFALLGILLVNIAIFSRPAQIIVLPLDASTPAVDRAADWLVRFLAEGKFYSLFSFLFGLGFALQMTRAEERGARLGWTYARRLIVLLGFGLIHAFLIWVGDILTVYALLGLLLLLFRKAKPRTLLIWAGVFLSLPILFYGFTVAMIELGRSAGPDVAAQIEQSFAEQDAVYRADVERANRAYASGNYFEITEQRAYDMTSFMGPGILFMAPGVFAMFLIGLYFGRRRLFQNIDEHLTFFRRLLWWGLAIGVPGNFVYAMLIQSLSRAQPSLTLLVATAGQTIGAPALSLAYVSAFVLLSRRVTWLNVLAPVGRFALSNYLTQSIICTLIFYGYGLGLFGKVGYALCLLLVVIIYAAQVAVSQWWARRFQFGPAEWLWRSLTYMKPQPMLR